MPEVPEDQEIVNEFAKLIVGDGELQDGDPRKHLIDITKITLFEYVTQTRYAYENGLLPLPDEGQFKSKFEIVKN